MPVPKKTVAGLGRVDFESLRDEILVTLDKGEGLIPRQVTRQVYERAGHTEHIAEEILFGLVRGELYEGKRYAHLAEQKRIRWHKAEAPWTRAARKRDGTLGDTYGLANADIQLPMLTDVGSVRQIEAALTELKLPNAAVLAARIVRNTLARITNRRNEFPIEIASGEVGVILAKLAEAVAAFEDMKRDRDNCRRMTQTLARIAEQRPDYGDEEEGEQPTDRPN